MTTDKEFQKLRRKWYAKLKADGFEDIEYINRETGESGNLLKGLGSMDMVRFYSHGKERYYQLMHQEAHRMEAAGEKGAAIVRRHANGESYVKIAGASRHWTYWTVSKTVLAAKERALRDFGHSERPE